MRKDRELESHQEFSELPSLPRYTTREEPFGYTLYDRISLNGRFIEKDKLDATLSSEGIDPQDCIYLPARRSDYRHDILYSPLRVYYELTLSCNLHCRLCFNSSGKPRQNELSTKEVLKSLDSLREANIIDLRLTGGELTERPDWYEIVKQTKRLGFVVSCNTNAVFTQPETPEKFAELNIDQVTVSVDGKAGHDKIRGRGNLDRTLANIQKMHTLGVRLRINTLLTKYSLKDYEFILKLASLYTDELNFFVPIFMGRGANHADTDSVTVEESAEFSRRIDELKPMYPGLNILHAMRSSKARSIDNNRLDKANLQPGPPSGFTTLNLTSDGSIWNGGYIPYIDTNLCLGNIKTDSIFDIWQGNGILEKQRKQAQALKAYCEACPVYDISCPGTKYEIELNRLLNPTIKNYYCIYGSSPSLLEVIK